MDVLQQIAETKSYLQSKEIQQPEIAVILGTGLGKRLVEQINVQQAIPYQSIPNFPVSTVDSHEGKLIYGNIDKKKILVMQGRFHYYEGYSMQQITFPVKLMKALGLKYLLISNAAGNLNLTWSTGDLMLLEDHINLQPDNPLRGKNIEELGPRFPDMSSSYDKNLNNLLKQIAKAKNIKLHQGVYAAVTGPSMETRAECRFLKKIGADVVGMSTVPEVIAANYLGIPCCAVSVLTNTSDPDNLQAVSFQDVLDAANKAEKAFVSLYIELIKQLN